MFSQLIPGADILDRIKRVYIFVIALMFYHFGLRLFAEAGGLALIIPGSLDGPLVFVVSQLLSFAVPVVAYVLITRQKFRDVLPYKPLNLTNTGLIILMCVAVTPLMMLIAAISSFVFPNNVASSLEALQTSPFSVTVFAVCVMPAFFEEITFRGVVLSDSVAIGIKKAALFNGLFFGLMHMDPQQFLYAFFLGAVFSAFVYYTKSILASMLAHFTVNFIQTALFFFAASLTEASGISGVSGAAGGTPTSAELVSALLNVFIVAAIFTPVFLIVFKNFIIYNKRKNVSDELLRAIYFEP